MTVTIMDLQKNKRNRRENEGLANAKILSKREKIELGIAVSLFYRKNDSKDE